MLKKRLMTFMLATAMTVSLAMPAMADTETELANARAKKSAAESDLSAAASKIDDLENKKSELQSYLTELNGKLGQLSDELDTLSTQLTEKTTEVEITKGAVERAKNDAQNQYKDMCMRIKYMYEHGKGDLLVSLLEADDLTEFLNKSNQITEMTTYDRNRLADYKESLEIVENKEEELVAEQANLENLKSQNAALASQIEELTAFKLKVEKAEKMKMINEDFCMLDAEYKEDVIANIDSYSLEDIEAKLSILCVRNKISFNAEEPTPGLAGPITYNVDGYEDPDDQVPAWVKAVLDTQKSL
jgi:peptidoglycan hydrolase CwlO-like protein